MITMSRVEDRATQGCDLSADSEAKDACCRVTDEVALQEQNTSGFGKKE